MKINIYFLIVGIFSILFSFTHAWNGHTAVLPIIDSANFGNTIKTTMFYVWHIVTIENFIFGFAFLIMAFFKDQSKVKFSAWIIATIILARWGIILGSTLLRDPGGLKNVMIDSIAIFLFVGLIIMGIYNAPKPSRL